MIEYKGELSNKCKNFVLKNETNVARISAIIVCVPIAIFDIWLALSNDLFYLIVLPILAFIVFLAGIKPREKSYGLIMTKRVRIEEDYLESEGERFNESRTIDQVKHVIDYGEWYKITFSFPYKSQRFVCQKDLIIQGTIEDFENLFSDKLIRRRGRK